jgi:hypothetical protein
MLVLTQTKLTWLFNSVYDFLRGWKYVLGVGVGGEMVFKAAIGSVRCGMILRPRRWQELFR